MASFIEQPHRGLSKTAHAPTEPPQLFERHGRATVRLQSETRWTFRHKPDRRSVNTSDHLVIFGSAPNRGAFHKSVHRRTPRSTSRRGGDESGITIVTHPFPHIFGRPVGTTASAGFWESRPPGECLIIHSRALQSTFFDSREACG